mmetsp:Transcript_19168/g.32933  ORF Transcript_19168/g.32933 Transcript_19168/m.32933 type:complete len:321 (-) Transcript_19168:234-1196(-)
MFGRVEEYGADRLLVVGEGCHCLACRQVPQPHRCVHRRRYNLWVAALGLHVTHGVVVSREAVDLGFRAHVPNSCYGVSTASDEDVEGGVEGYGVDAREVAVVVADLLVVLEVPALHHLVLPAREQVRVPRVHRQPSDCVDVPRQCQLQRPSRQVPNLDSAVSGAGAEPLVCHVDRYGAHPALVPADHAHELPWGMPLGLDCLGLLDQRLSRVLHGLVTLRKPCCLLVFRKSLRHLAALDARFRGRKCGKGAFHCRFRKRCVDSGGRCKLYAWSIWIRMICSNLPSLQFVRAVWDAELLCRVHIQRHGAFLGRIREGCSGP